MNHISLKEYKNKLNHLLENAKKLAVSYYNLTGKPLGITGEIAEWQVSELLNLDLAEARTAGYDAIDKNGKKIQIKSRRIVNSKQAKCGRTGSIKFDHEWDSVMFVLMDKNYDVITIHECSRENIKREVMKPGSKSRNERGALSASVMKRVGVQVWPKIM